MDLKDQVELASEETNENQELALKFKNRRRKEDNDLHVTSSFSIEVGKYYDKYIKYEKQTLFAKVIYTTLQPVLIAMVLDNGSEIILCTITPYLERKRSFRSKI